MRMLIEEGHDVAAVWCPVYASGDGANGGKLDPLYQAASPMGEYSKVVPLVQRTPVSVKQLEVDLFVAAHSHDFIGRQSRAATRLGGIGYHPSLLPRHRGRDAVRWTIHMGDPVAGGSVYWLTDNVDGGPIAAQDWCFVPPAWRTAAHPAEGASMLWKQELFPMGVALLAKALRHLDNGVIVEVPQDELNATWEPSWDRPPLFKPELPQIGEGVPGFTHVTRKGPY